MGHIACILSSSQTISKIFGIEINHSIWIKLSARFEAIAFLVSSSLVFVLLSISLSLLLCGRRFLSAVLLVIFKIWKVLNIQVHFDLSSHLSKSNFLLSGRID